MPLIVELLGLWVICLSFVVQMNWLPFMASFRIMSYCCRVWWETMYNKHTPYSSIDWSIRMLIPSTNKQRGYSLGYLMATPTARLLHGESRMVQGRSVAMTREEMEAGYKTYTFTYTFTNIPWTKAVYKSNDTHCSHCVASLSATEAHQYQWGLFTSTVHT